MESVEPSRVTCLLANRQLHRKNLVLLAITRPVDEHEGGMNVAQMTLQCASFVARPVAEQGCKSITLLILSVSLADVSMAADDVHWYDDGRLLTPSLEGRTASSPNQGTAFFRTALLGRAAP